jgi:hypothetical protein
VTISIFLYADCICNYREFLDLSRNQRLLRQLVTRRGIRVHDNILKGLQVIKDILGGEGPYNIPKSLGSRLL